MSNPGHMTFWPFVAYACLVRDAAVRERYRGVKRETAVAQTSGNVPCHGITDGNHGYSCRARSLVTGVFLGASSATRLNPANAASHRTHEGIFPRHATISNPPFGHDSAGLASRCRLRVASTDENVGTRHSESSPGHYFQFIMRRVAFFSRVVRLPIFYWSFELRTLISKT